MLSAAKLSIVIGVLSISQLILAPDAFGQGRRGGGGGWGGRGGDGGPGGDNRGPGGPGGGGPGGDFRGRGGDGTMSSNDIAQRVARTGDFLKRIDTNGNGVIDPDEASDPNAKGMLDRVFQRMGKEPHYPVSISEIMQGYEAYYKSRAAGSGGGGGSPPSPGAPPSGSSRSGPPPVAGTTTPSPSGMTSPPGLGFGPPAATPAPRASNPYSSNWSSRQAAPVASQANLITATSESTTSAESKPAQPKHSKFKSKRDGLPKDLPTWFLKLDVNGDGQITMAQYATDWTPKKVEDFNRYDLNHDGIITAEECLKVEKGK